MLLDMWGVESPWAVWAGHLDALSFGGLVKVDDMVEKIPFCGQVHRAELALDPGRLQEYQKNLIEYITN